MTESKGGDVLQDSQLLLKGGLVVKYLFPVKMAFAICFKFDLA